MKSSHSCFHIGGIEGRFKCRKGYYMQRDVFGLCGDFVTSQELSQMFEKNDYGGECILSAKVEYFTNNDTIKVDKFVSKSICEFCTYLTIFTILFPLVYGSYSAYALYQTIENATQMWVLPAVMANLLLLILKFTSSCILSVGVSELCKSVTSSSDAITTCKAAQAKAWYNGNWVAVNGKNYDTYLTTAQSASWFCVLEWALLTILAFLHYRRNIALRSTGISIQADEGGFGTASSDTAGVVANEFLPGTSVVNPNFNDNDVPPLPFGN